jgi:hypothetical protein
LAIGCAIEPSPVDCRSPAYGGGFVYSPPPQAMRHYSPPPPSIIVPPLLAIPYMGSITET